MSEKRGICGYGKNEYETLLNYLQLKRLGETELEVWLIDRNRYEMFFVILTHHEKPHRGRKPKLPKLIKRVDVEHPIVMFEDYREEKVRV